MVVVSPQDVSREGRCVDTSVSSLWLDEEDLLRWTYFDGAVVTLKEAKEEVEVAGEIVDRYLRPMDTGRPVRILVDLRPIRTASREARELFGSDAYSERMFVTGNAIVVNSTVSKMLANSFFYWTRPKHPTRLFTDVEEAKLWLRKLSPRGVSNAS